MYVHFSNIAKQCMGYSSSNNDANLSIKIIPLR